MRVEVRKGYQLEVRAVGKDLFPSQNPVGENDGRSYNELAHGVWVPPAMTAIDEKNVSVSR